MQAVGATARTNIVKWRSLANSGRKMSSNDLVNAVAPKKDLPTEKGKEKKDKKKKP